MNPTPFSFYPKVGYGEVSEHTIGAAFDVAIGVAPMPQRPVEDALFAASEETAPPVLGTLTEQLRGVVLLALVAPSCAGRTAGYAWVRGD